MKDKVDETPEEWADRLAKIRNEANVLLAEKAIEKADEGIKMGKEALNEVAKLGIFPRKK